MAFSRKDEQDLFALEENVPLRLSSEEKYKKYKEKDPFPEINDALLNSVDIVKYCMTVDMISPFNIEKVDGVTYTCHFSGRYFYWDDKDDKGNLVKKTETDTPVLILRANSITYLEIQEKFQVPDYLIIRYNLQVNHVYKGLLLGTGPIVDPGFVGHLYIPLHNLTSNEYQIKKGAPLITLEFTKVNRISNGTGYHWPEAENNSCLNFEGLHHQPKVIEPNRDFDTYLYKALVKNSLFKSTGDQLSVGSSIPEEIRKAEQSAEKCERTLSRAAKVIYAFGLGGAIALVIAVVSLFNDINGRIDSVVSNNMSILEENLRLEEENAKVLKENANLQMQLDELLQEVSSTLLDEEKSRSDG